MSGMDMGVATPVGSFASFIVMWAVMMSAMMLPVVLRHAQAGGRALTVLPFIGSYLTVWAFVGVPVYALYQPHGTLVAGVITIVAGLYEFTPLKRFCRRHCCESMRSGFECGLYCMGSCIGLMLMQVALGVMSVTWMSVITVLISAQKLLRARATIDIPLALMIIGLGILIIIAPSMVPGLIPTM